MLYCLMAAGENAAAVMKGKTHSSRPEFRYSLLLRPATTVVGREAEGLFPGRADPKTVLLHCAVAEAETCQWHSRGANR